MSSGEIEAMSAINKSWMSSEEIEAMSTMCVGRSGFGAATNVMGWRMARTNGEMGVICW